MAKNPIDEGDDLADDVCIISSENGNNNRSARKTTIRNSITKEQGKSSQTQKKRGRPTKDGQNTKAVKKQACMETVSTVPERVRGESRRVSHPSQYQLSPYKQH